MQIDVDLMVLEATYDKNREEHCHFQRHPLVIKTKKKIWMSILFLM